MKKHLLTAALAIVAVGGVFAMNANTKTSNKNLVTTYYERVSDSECNTITCDPNFTGSACKQTLELYSLPNCSSLVTPPITYKRP
ncbi:DUF6520 family protein [Pedobacter sp. ASV1-7]|uniref:DUF6520 family protein n=1 Tax=Pedobacter sp. ASV1-7 TaxID=3145237 RepID=UPI0032E91876